MEKTLLEIVKKIKQNNVTLFLGAGCSISAGLPDWKDLIDSIKCQFPKCDHSIVDFFDLCQDVLDTPPYNRNDLEEFVISRFNKFEPTEAHKELTKYNWNAIFTTNYDNILEVAYNLEKNRLRSFKSIYIGNPSVNIADRSSTYIFKVMGCITSQEEDGNIILTRTDYNYSLRKRRKYFELLKDFVKNGTIVYIGYSFKDSIARDIINEITSTYGIERLPWSYALYNSDLPQDDKSNYFFSKNKIIPIKCSFENFFDLIKTYIPPENVTVPTFLTSTIRLFTKTIEIKNDDSKLYANSFEFLHDEILNSEIGDKDSFFKGATNLWSAYKNKWDFQRDIYLDDNYFKDGTLCIKNKIKTELSKNDPSKNEILLITGMPGCGKTVLGRRIAFDFYSTGHTPVIFINSFYSNIDFKVVSSFIETITSELDKERRFNENYQPIKPIIIIDDAHLFDQLIFRLKEWLTSRGRSILIIAIARDNEILNSEFQRERIRTENKYQLNEILTENENKNIVEHLFNLHYLPSQYVSWIDTVKNDFESSFFATIYSLVHPSKKPLDEIIKDQFNGLNELSKKAFISISLFNQFSVPINIELLVRTLSVSYEKFIEQIINKDASKIIFQQTDVSGNLFFATHHKIIAKKTLNFFLPDSKQQFEQYCSIFNNVNSGNYKEVELCEQLLLGNFSIKTKNEFFNHEQKTILFRIACEHFPTRSLYHHWGILEIDKNNYLEAASLLQKALTDTRICDNYKNESEQNILTTIGKLYSRQGQAELQKDNFNNDKVEEYFLKAEQAFEQAKHGDYPNPYAYHAHAYLWYSKAKRNNINEYEKIGFLTKALEITSLAKDNLNEEELEVIIELENQIYELIKDNINVEKSIDVLRDKFHSSKGYFLSAFFHLQNGKSIENGFLASQEFELGIKKIEKGLRHFSNDESLLYLRCRIYTELIHRGGGNSESHFNYLNLWYQNKIRDNVLLYYELGRTSFVMGYFDISLDVFKELQSRIGVGNNKRSKNINPILTDKGTLEEFQGEIVNIFSKYEGLIRCSTLNDLKYRIPFRPIAAKFTPDVHVHVRFNIAFSFRGPYAINIIKI